VEIELRQQSGLSGRRSRPHSVGTLVWHAKRWGPSREEWGTDNAYNGGDAEGTINIHIRSNVPEDLNIIDIVNHGAHLSLIIKDASHHLFLTLGRSFDSEGHLATYL
jgi:hypothetical protein